MEAKPSRYDWIMARLDEGKTVYISTATRHTKITPKHRWAVTQDSKGECYIARGKHRDSIAWCKLTAVDE